MIMNKYFLLFLGLVFLNLNGFAVDRIVQENGPVSTYSGIMAAVNAASDGDRIIIVNRAIGYWVEDVTVTKSLEFVPAVDGTRFVMEGDFTINPTLAGAEIRIIGMENLDGDIEASYDAPTGAFAKIYIAGSSLRGDVDFDYDYYNLIFAGNTSNGSVFFNFGGIYGNDFSSGPYTTSIRVGASSLSSDEYINIIGNKCKLIFWESSSYFFRIMNNTISSTGIRINDDVKNSSLKDNLIVNNSITLSSFNSWEAIKFGFNVGPTIGRVQILNNAIDESYTGSQSTEGVSNYGSNTLTIFASYNHIDNSFDDKFYQVTDDGTNVVNSVVTIAVDGTPTGPSITDGGAPFNWYYDLNLTRNDPGAFGGSYSLQNYFPLSSGNAKVYFIRANNIINPGESLNAEADGFDR